MKLKWTDHEGFKKFLIHHPLPENWQECLFYAESMIDYVTLNRIRKVEDKPEVMELVRNAIYAQARYYAETGIEMDMMSSGNVASFQLGQMAMQFKEHNNTGNLNPQALRFLTLSGLMYRGVKL